jgi:hypothetical protein
VLLEYLPEGSPDCPLLRLFAFTSAEAGALKSAVADMAKRRAEPIAVHEMPGVFAVNGCKLVLRVQERDGAVVQTGLMAFECGFTAGTWDNVAGLLEPFANESSGYQWLAGTPGEARLLISANGEW